MLLLDLKGEGMSETPNLRFIQLACQQINIAHDHFLETGRSLSSSIVSELVRFFETRKDSLKKCTIRPLHAQLMVETTALVI